MDETGENGSASERRRWADVLVWPVRRLARSAFGPRRSLWLALAIVVVPLVLMLGFQYFLLVQLERKSTIAHYATLNKQLDLLTKEIAFHFVSSAERVVRVPPWLFTRECACYDEYFSDTALRLDEPPRDPVRRQAWLDLPGQGARLFFMSSFVGPAAGQLAVYDMHSRTRVSEDEVPGAVRLAVYYWQIRVGKALASVNPKDLVPDNSDPANPIVLGLISDEKGRVVGVAGVVLDAEFFAREVLPTIVHRVLPSVGEGKDTAVTVWDGEGHEVWAAAGETPAQHETKRQLSFVLTDWRIALGSHGSTGAQTARTSFVVNLSLAALFAAVLMAGVVLAMRTAAREMKLSEMKSDFVSNVSHELRTPLSSIRVFGELMRLGRVRDMGKVREYGEYIECEGRRLSRLIDNILDFSRIEAGRKAYRVEDQDLGAVVRDVAAAIDVRLRREGFTVEVVAPDQPLPLVSIDAAAIGHALNNLVDNAAKYSGTSRRIVISLSESEDEVSVGVRDFGIGIPRDEHERIFTRFHRVGTGLVHDVKGSGLGLAIVQHVVSAHGGRVTVESAPGKGSLFAIHLPVAASGQEGNGGNGHGDDGRKG